MKSKNGVTVTSSSRRMLGSLTDAILLPVRLGALRTMLANSPSRQIAGVLVADITAEPQSNVRLDKVTQAMLLVHELDPRRFRRIVSDLRRIVITRAQSAAEYVSAASACFMDAAYVETRSREVLASAIVHEATHARLTKRGIPNHPELRSRIEHRCVREEIAFLRRVEGSEPLVKALIERLNEPWWTDDLAYKRRVDQLRGLGAPAWLVRIHGFLFRPN